MPIRPTDDMAHFFKQNIDSRNIHVSVINLNLELIYVQRSHSDIEYIYFGR